MREIFDGVQEIRPEELFFSWEEKITSLSGEEVFRFAALAAVGLLLCLLGLKIVRVWAALFGLAAGFACGAGAAYLLGLNNTAILITGGVIGAALAFLGAFFYKFGVFMTVFFSAGAIYIQIVQPTEMISAVAGLAAALVAAVLAVIFAEVLTIIATSVWGGILAGTSVYQLVPVRGRMMSILLCIIFAILGIIVQLLLESRKRKRKNLQKAAEIRETHSTENEVEKARSLIDDFERMPDEPEDEPGETTDGREDI